MNNLSVQAFFDESSFSITYVVIDSRNKTGAIIDSVLGFEMETGRIDISPAEKIISFVGKNELEIEWILETHVHADHISASAYLKKHLGGKIAISSGIERVRKFFEPMFSMDGTLSIENSQFDHLFSDNEDFYVGDLKGKVIHTPGHTPACATYIIGNSIFSGDTILMPDTGTGRTDFPGGDAQTLYASAQRILKFPKEFRLFTCHDYGSVNRQYAWETTVGEQKELNLHIRDGITEKEYVKIRNDRDAQLNIPKLFLPSIQVNIAAGTLPKKKKNGVRYLQIPINQI